MRGRSIRFRLTVWYALVLSAALVLFGGLLWISLRARLMGELDEELRGTAARFETYIRREALELSGTELKTEMEEFCQGLPASSYLELHGSRGFEFRYPENRAQRFNGAKRVQTGFTIGTESFQLEVGESAYSIEHTLDLLGVLLIGLIPVVIGLASVGGAWLSRRALRPVDEITTAARAISIENLSQRLPVPATGDEIERLTEVWNTMLARLDSAVQTLSQFAADASHELRTPLAVIRTSAELALRRAREPEAYRESLGEVSAEAERMTQLVEDLLFLAHSDASATRMPMGVFDIRDAVEDAVAELGDSVTRRQVKFRLAVPDVDTLVRGNRAALRRLFIVLMDNAIKYSASGGVVNVQVRQCPDSVEVAVEDSGIGIGPGDLPHIFKRFYRADKARSNGGHGLGLSLANTIAQLHGSTIRVESAEGAGSVFSVVLPRS